MLLKGIYQIKNTINEKIYIGSSKNIPKRWNEHITNLNNQTHHSYKLQNDWLKYEIKNFSFTIIEIVNDDKKLLEREQFYIDQFEMEDLYNVMSDTKYNNKISVPDTFINTINYLDTLLPGTIKNLKMNLNIFDKTGKLKNMGNNKNDLSKTWFNKNQTKFRQLSLGIYNCFNNFYHAKSNEIAWTTFTQYYYQLKFNGFVKSFVPLNGELTNTINKRNYLCFAANCFPNSFIKRKAEIEVNNDEYALSILINWIINVSDIRKPIYIYLPSQRMENILRK